MGVSKKEKPRRLKEESGKESDGYWGWRGDKNTSFEWILVPCATLPAVSHEW